MLSEFRVRNFRNFTEWLVFSLETPDMYGFNQEAVYNGIIKDAVVIGHNASGKTNLGTAIMDITIHLADKDSPCPFSSGLSVQDSNMSFMYKFKFGRNVLEYSYEKTEAGSLVQECVRIDGKMVLATGNGSVFVCLNGAGSLNLSRWDYDYQASFTRYVYDNAVLDAEDTYCKAFLEFIKFVKGMSYCSSWESTDGQNFSSGSDKIFENICVSVDGVKGLEKFLEEAGMQTTLIEKDTPGGKTVYCKIGNKEVPLEEVLSSGMKSLILLYLWYVGRKDFSFLFLDDFAAFYHTGLSRSILTRLVTEKDIQVVFISNNTDIISNRILRPDCYFILKDNTIQPFCNLTNRELKEGHNLQKMYEAGEFDRRY